MFCFDVVVAAAVVQPINLTAHPNHRYLLAHMFGILSGPEFNSPARRPTSSLGILGAVQKQAVSVIKARLPAEGLLARKAAAGAAPVSNDFICGVDNVDPILFDVLPNELVFTIADDKPDDTSMSSFVSSHQVYGKQFLTGDIQVEGFTALNGIKKGTHDPDGKLVFIGWSARCRQRTRFVSLRRRRHEFPDPEKRHRRLRGASQRLRYNQQRQQRLYLRRRLGIVDHSNGGTAFIDDCWRSATKSPRPSGRFQCAQKYAHVRRRDRKFAIRRAPRKCNHWTCVDKCDTVPGVRHYASRLTRFFT